MMSTNPATVDAEQEIQRLVAVILGKRPLLAGLVQPVAALFAEKARVASGLQDDLDPVRFEVSGVRLSEGIPILAGISLSFLKPALDRAFTALVPAAKTLFPAVGPYIDRMEIAQRNGSIDLSHLSEEYLGGGLKGFRDAPQTSEVDRHGLGFVVNLVLSTVLQPLAASLSAQMEQIHWDRGYCPVCGSLPSISYLSKAECSSSEFLVGGGGQRYLHCAMCGQDWRVRRHLCAACERDDTDEHLYFHVPDAVGERVDICRHCSHYLPCIDLREVDILSHLDILSVGLAHLDMLAQEKGFSPLVRTPWNTFE